MNGLKNVAGNDVSIFLFRFDLQGSKGIDFVLNEAIAADMYPDIDVKMKPLAHACCETLLRYRHLSVSSTILDCNVLDTGEVEVMLSRGLGKYFAEEEKNNLFEDAKSISDLLHEVMERKTKELKEGKVSSAVSLGATASQIRQGLEKLGQAKHDQFKLESLALGYRPKPGFKPLRPEDLPRGVTASPGYDHRGQCLVFRHRTLGELGRIVLIRASDTQTVLQSDVYLGSEKEGDPRSAKRKLTFEEVVAIVEKCFQDNFPE
jgi:hypothetical protein